MKRIFSATAIVFCAISAFAVDINDTRLLSDPAVSKDHIAFAYANDLWVANLDGTNVRRLTSHPGIESGPRFSPDGSMIAFTGRYDGNTDAYVVPTAGGVPKRLTWHPNNDIVLGFTPDGQNVLFSSPREVYTRRFTQLFTVPVSGGLATKLPIPNASKATYSADGKKIVYQPIGDAFIEWKHYRGGQVARLMIFDTATNAVEQIPQPATRSNDTDPMWIGDKVYFRSDRAGEFNLFSYDPATKQVAQLTRFSDWPILGATAGSGKIIFERGGYLSLLDPRSGSDNRLKIGVAADLNETRPRFAKGAKYVRNASLSPSGARAAFEFRGEIVTIPMEKGDDRNLTQSVSANDRNPIWSPDGKLIAYFTDESGENELRIAPQDGKGAVRNIKMNGAGFYRDINWSPDGTKISYQDNSSSLYLLDVASGASTKLESNTMQGDIDQAWSPDSKWIAYTHNSVQNFNTIQLYSLDQKKSFPLTDGLEQAIAPVFDPGGKYLYFIVSTDAGPLADFFSMWSLDTKATNTVYLAVLPKGVVSPLAKESDEEGKKDASADEKKPEDAAKTADAAAEPKTDEKPAAPKKAAKTVIDMDGLTNRIQALPLSPASYGSLQVAKSGELYYIKRSEMAGRGERQPGTLMHYSLSKRKEETALEKVLDVELSRDGKRMLLRLPDNAWSIADVAEKIDATKHKLAVDKVEVKIDPTVEWREIFDEAWRINRDYFYDPNMHGVDWNAAKAKYSVFLPDMTTRQDLTRVLAWMHSELVVGHHRQSGGDSLANTDTIPGGLLGADYKVENGRYRFAKVFGGLNWNPELRSPLTEAGVDVKDGEYLLAVEGKDLKPPEDIYSRFERTAGRIVEITVGPNADGTGSRTVKVVPIEDEGALRNRDWVERNLRYVTEKTGGRVAYVYVPNTTTLGYDYFRRYFFPQADRQAIIIDERHNAGGQAADYYLDFLRRPFMSYWARRYGADLRTPLAAIQGPKVMIIDETAGSGGDYLPWMFRKSKLGTIVGRRTWGGLVGISGFPVLMDGGTITAPNFAIWAPEGGWVVENEGVPPDIEIEQTPAEIIAGRDPQLDKAIEVALKQLEANPQVVPKRPAYPVKAR
ncbi:MAG: PDZ domain-containing protein [Acidobacteriota bacterium]|nr:PDZ domain-containing protein [Acidobacteriota bacterium]